MKRATLAYVGFYLLSGGLGFAFAPAPTLRLFLSNGEYGDVMPRVVGMFMLALGAFVAEFVRRSDLSYYTYTVVVRSLIVVFLLFLYVRSRDPLFFVVLAIVTLGLVPSIWVLGRERLARDATQ